MSLAGSNYQIGSSFLFSHPVSIG